MSDPEQAENEPSRLTPNEFGPDTRDNYHVLKHNDLFAVFSSTGCMNGSNVGLGELHCKDGLFADDMRVLSRLVLSLNRTSVTELGAETSEDTAIFRASLSNRRLVDASGRVVPPYALHIDRGRFLADGLFETIRVTNYHHRDIDLDLVLDCWADFRDIFEVRGLERPRRGRLLAPAAMSCGLVFGYETLDGKRYATEVRVSRNVETNAGRIHVPAGLAPGETLELECVVRSEALAETAEPAPFRDRAPKVTQARKSAVERVEHIKSSLDIVRSSRPAFDDWLGRSACDIAMLTSDLATGPYPYAGIPWFSAPFGRDGVVTALETLWLNPALAGGVLDFLAATQAKREDPARVAAPGKIIHERRKGEMARTGEVPFGQYYGGVDQTLLFVILAERYWRRSGDRDRLKRLKPAVDAALDWAAGAGDPDGDGLIEYRSDFARGLRNQGWKDSDDAIFHADGTLCEGPIALVEVQAYHAAALRSAAEIETELGNPERAERLRAQARSVEARLDELFWDDDLSTWALALDGEKRPANVATSNAGHVLFAGAATPERARLFADRFERGGLLTDWGVRTVAPGEVRFNPMGYHTGSIWPHDSAMVAAGLAKYGRKDLALQIFEALFEAARHFAGSRLPELYCGFSHDINPRVVAYPSACSPQVWAAGAPFMCLQAVLGIEIDAPKSRVSIANPQLPRKVERLDIESLPVGESLVDLRFVRDAEGGTHLEVRRAPDHVDFSLQIG